MTRRSSALTLAVVFALVGWSSGPAAFRGGDLPERLSDQEFWRLMEELSEPNGYFRSDNLLSNEQVFARVIPELVSAAKPGGVYLGVGPEQNFTYIAAIKPKIAFIIDIRRGNLHPAIDVQGALRDVSPIAPISSRDSSRENGRRA